MINAKNMVRSKVVILCLTAVILASSFLLVAGWTHSYETTKDTYLREGSPDNNYGTDSYITFDDSAYKGLIYLDYFSTDDFYEIPFGAPIEFAYLNVYHSSGSSFDTLYAYPMMTDWSETGATWNNKNSTDTWSTPGMAAGVDYNNTAEFVSSVGGDIGEWRIFDVTAWINETVWERQENYGWTLIASDGTNQDVRSLDYTGTTSDPFLNISYTYPDPHFSDLGPWNSSSQPKVPYYTNDPIVNFTCNASIAYASTQHQVEEMNIVVSPCDDEYETSCMFSEFGTIVNVTYYNATSTPVITNWAYITGQYNFTDDGEGTYYWDCWASLVYQPIDTSVPWWGMSDYNATEGISYYEKIIYDATVPQITFADPTPADGNRETSNSVSINVSINDTAFDTCILEWNNTASVTNYTMTENGDYCNYTISTTDGTEYFYRVYANDTAGNGFNSTALRNFTENTVPSIPSTISMTPDPAYNNATFTCSASGSSDDESDSLTYYYQFSNDDGVMQSYSTENTFICYEAYCRKGMTINCSSKAYDSYEYGGVNSTTIVTSNVVPIINEWNITNGTWSNSSGTDIDIYENSTGGTYTFNITNVTDQDNIYYWCYQETANVSTDCGGNNTGAYWTVEDTYPYLYVNYTKPNNATSDSLIQVKIGETATQNLSIPTACWDAYADKVRFRFYSTVTQSAVDCHKGSSWEVLTSESGSGVISASAADWTNMIDGNWSTGANYDSDSSRWEFDATNDGTIWEEAMVWRIQGGVETHWYDWFIDGVRKTVNAIQSWFDWVLGSDYAVGEHNVTVYVNDTSGDQTSQYWNITINDVTNPAVSLVYPTGTYTTKTSLPLNLTTYDVHNDSCWYTLNGGIDNTTLTDCANTTFNVASDGEYTLTVYMNDTSNNVNSDSSTFTVDSSNPDIEFVSPTPDANDNVSASSIYVNISSLDLSPYYVATDFNGDLLSKITMDDINGSSDPTDTSRYAKNATAYGNSAQEDGYFGQGFSFDGNGDYLLVDDPTLFDSNGSFTVSAWIYLKKNTLDTDSMIFRLGNSSSTNDIMLRAGNDITSNEYFQIGVYTDSGWQLASLIDDTIALNTWYHLVGTWDASANNLTLYVNGSLANSTVYAGENRGSSYADYAIIGAAELWTTPRYFNGTIDEFMFWNRSLDSNEISSLYSASGYYHNFTSLNDGTYTFKSYAMDTAGNTNETELRSVLLDDTNPSASQTNPADNAYNSTTEQNYTASLSDNSGIKNTTLYIYNSTDDLVNETTTSYGSGITSTVVGTVVDLIEGVYKWFYKVFDWSGNSYTTGNRTITLDSTDPVVSYDASTTTDGIWVTDGNILVNISAADDNLDDVQFEWNGANETFDNNDGDYYWELQSGLSTGSYTFYGWADDLANNLEVLASRTVNVDREDPTVNIVRPLNINYNYNESLPLNISFSDTNLEDCWYNFNGEANQSIICGNNITFNISEGTHTVYAYANDSSGRVGSDEVTFTVNLAPPSITLDYPEDDSWLDTNSVQLNWTPTDTDGVSSCELYGNWSGGWHLNESISPVVSGNQITRTKTIPDGTYIWNVRCNDTGDNWAWGNPTANDTFYVDATFPLIDYTVNTPTDETNTTATNIFVGVSVTESNEDTIIFSLYNDSGEVNSTSFTDSTRSINWTGLIDNTYYFNVTINDSAGNTNTTDTYTVRLDDTGPDITLDSPQSINYGYNESINLNMSVSDNLVGVDVCWYNVINSTGDTIIETTIIPDCSNQTFSVPSGDIDYTIELFANDTNGNEDSAGVVFGVRMIAPAVVIDNPTDDQYFNTLNNIPFNVTITDPDNEIDTCELWGNWTGVWHKNQTVMSITTDVQKAFNSLNLTEDSFSMNVWCNDSYGNSDWALNNRTFTTDITNPGVAFITSDGASVSTTFTFEYNVSDLHRDSCEFNLESGGSWVYTPNQSLDCTDTSKSITVSAGTYNLWIWATDAATNTNESSISITASAPETPGGGGGSTGDDTPTVGNLSWEVFANTQKTSKSYHFEVIGGSERNREIYFYNDDIEEIDISLTCEGDLCEFMTLAQTNITLPVGLAIPTEVKFDLEMPLELSQDTYTANIRAVDHQNKEDIITIEAEPSAAGASIEAFTKLGQSRSLFGLPVPYLIISFFVAALVFAVFNYFILKKIKMGLAISIVLAFFAGIGVLFLI